VIRLESAESPLHRLAFTRLSSRVYGAMPQHRSTDDELVEMLLRRRTVFLEHARLEPYLVLDGKEAVARFALLQDQRRPEYVQIAFFEALPGVEGLLQLVMERARQRFSGCAKVVAGLNGHLNYGAGFLANRFDEAPVFGLPHTPEYYLDYFSGLRRRDMVSFRFATAPFYSRLEQTARAPSGGITFRTMDRRHLARDAAIYTELNNACFREHPYWADRDAAEDLELFKPFRFFLQDENLIFAERDGRPVGFLLWYPDFNELAANGEPLGLKHLLRLRLFGRLGGRRVRSMRLTEIAVLPELRNGWVVAGLFRQLTLLTRGKGFEHCEGGFIFEENLPCISMTLSALRRAVGQRLSAYRRYCLFEGSL
jgi:hypothetical protein